MIFQLQKLVTILGAGKEAYCTKTGAGKEAYCTKTCAGKRIYIFLLFKSKQCGKLASKASQSRVGGEGSQSSLDQGLSKHQEFSSTPVTKVTKLIVLFWDLLGSIKR